MEDRKAALLFLGSFPTEQIEHADPGLKRQDFEKSLRGYLKEQNFPHKLSPRLVGKLFKMTCFFRRKRKVLPEMLRIVRSREWAARARLLLRLSGVEMPRMRRKLIRYARRHRSRPKAVALWTSRQLKTLSQTLWFAFKVQQMEFHAVHSMARPPIDSQFLYDIRDVLRDRMRRTSVADIDIVVAACAVAAHIFSSKDDANDIVSRIPMRISRAEKTFAEQAENAKNGWLSPF
jgi:hypothetical protein